ncbi:hypothetical protein GCM10028781_11530 [Nostocoides australiense]
MISEPACEIPTGDEMTHAPHGPDTVPRQIGNTHNWPRTNPIRRITGLNMTSNERNFGAPRDKRLPE